MELVSWVGMAGTVLAFVLFLPQARHTWTNRGRPERLRGISVTGQVCVIANALVWGLYALLTGAFWTGAPGIINAPVAVCTIVLLLRGRRQSPVPPACAACAAQIEHRVFITNPAGWGSVMDCTDASRPHGVIIFSLDEARQLRQQRPG